MLNDRPSLRTQGENVFAECYRRARRVAGRETGLDIAVFPELAPFSIDQVLAPEDLVDDR